MSSHGQYEKRPGAADVSGQMYEIGLATLLYVRCVRQGVPFVLASNFSPAGNFDDLVLARPRQTLFVQLKHRQNRTKIPCNALLRLNPKGGFGLPTYLRSYLAARSCIPQLAAHFGSPLCPQDITVIIFTNAQFQEIRSAMDVCNGEPLLETGGTCLRPGEGVVQYFRQLQDYKNQLRGKAVSDTITHPELVSKLESLSKSANREWLLNKMIEELDSVGELIEQSEFLKNVKVYQNQASLEDLGKLVKIEIKEVFFCSNKETDVLYSQLFDMVKTWWTSSSSYLDQNSQIWHNLVTARIDKINHKFHKSHRTICVNFREEILEGVKNEVYRNQALLVQSRASIPLLSLQKVCQALQGDKYVIATATDEFINRYIHVCESRWCNILVLEVLDIISNDLSNRICTFLSRGPNKRVIFVGTIAGNVLTNSITNIDNNITLLDFDERTHSDFMNTPIDFQGISLTLGQISKDILEGLTEDHILELGGTVQPVVIGRKLDPVIEYYVRRTLGRSNIVQDSFFRHLGSHSVCAVLGTTVTEIKDIVGMSCNVYEFNFIPHKCNPGHPTFIILDTEQAEQQYADICELFRDCKIFCLERESGRWKWLKCSGDIGEIKKFIEPTECFYQIEDIVSSSERAISIVGVPGNGKSTLVTQIARVLKGKYPMLWVIRINLSQQMEIFSKFEHVDKTIADMILKMATGSLNWNSMKLSHFFLESCLKREASVAVLLDGFDEISPNYTSKGCELVKSLLENKSVFKVIVTSRPVTRNAVEEIMCTVSFQLHVFNECEKEIFFEKYLLNKLKSSKRNKDVLSKVKDFIGNIDNHIDTKFTAIPLHASILAEALSSDTCKFYARENQKSSNRIDILELYESFFEKKITISLTEREGIDYTRPESQNVINVFRRKHENDHMYLALRALFTFNDLATLNIDVKGNVDSAVAQVESIYEKTGIVYCVDNGKPRFVHKTFAEYFAALWLSQNFKGNSAFVKKLFDRGFEVTRHMFDRFLMREHELHSAAADGDEDRVGYLISQGRLVNARDSGGRKPLHVAAMYGSADAVRQLLRVTSRLQDADEVLKWTPLRYAERTASWEVAEMLLAAGASPKGMFQAAKSSESLQGFLRLFAEKGLTNLARHLIAKGANPTAVLSPDSHHAALHVAAANGHVDLVSYLYAGTGRLFSSLRYVFGSSAALASCEALHVASAAAQLGVVRYLVTVCDDVDARDAGGLTALHHACGAHSRAAEGHVVVVQCLLDAGADAVARDAGGWTPLHFAACGNEPRIVRVLLDAGVNPRVATDEGDTAFDIAQRFGKEDTALALLVADDGASSEFRVSRKKFVKGKSDTRRLRSNAVLRIVDEDTSTV